MRVPGSIFIVLPTLAGAGAQDRVLFGKDTYEPSECPYFFRVFETHDEYFDYYRPYHAFWKLNGMGLSDTVLRKLYYQNALKVEPGLPQTGWSK